MIIAATPIPIHSLPSAPVSFPARNQASSSEQAYALAPIAQIPQFAFAGRRHHNKRGGQIACMATHLQNVERKKCV